MPESMEVSNDLFFESVLEHISLGKRVRINAKGMSMLPLIRPGKDTIVLAPLEASSVARGALVLALLSGRRYVLHRIESVDGAKVVLRGDGNPYVRERCVVGDLLAEAVVIERPDGRQIRKDSIGWWCARYLWPRHGLVRRIMLYVLRRL